MATMLQVGPPMTLFFLLYTVLQRYCGCCPLEEEEDTPAEDNEQKTNAERAKEIEAFLSKSDKNIFTDSVMQYNENKYGLVLQGMTKVKLTTDIKETNIL